MELYPASIDILYDGMKVDYGIYAYHNGKPVLLCKDVVLTSNMIQSLKKAMTNCQNVYMDQVHHEQLLKNTPYFKQAQAKLEKDVGYDVMRDNMESAFGSIIEHGSVYGDSIENLAKDINKKLDDVDGALIMQCINGMRDTDKYLYAHSLNVGFLNGLIAQWSGMSSDMVNKAIKAGVLHDIGKTKLPKNILEKPGKLTALEYEIVKSHPELGYDMLIHSGEKDTDILEAVLHHHERVNGRGYPGKKRGDEITDIAKITAVSDVYDAMTSKRPYRDAISPFFVLEELDTDAFSELDMRYIKLIMENMPNELLGRSVLLSNGAVAKVEYIDRRHLGYPIVSIDGKIEKTNSELCCVRMYAG